MRNSSNGKLRLRPIGSGRYSTVRWDRESPVLPVRNIRSGWRAFFSNDRQIKAKHLMNNRVPFPRILARFCTANSRNWVWSWVFAREMFVCREGRLVLSPVVLSRLGVTLSDNNFSTNSNIIGTQKKCSTVSDESSTGIFSGRNPAASGLGLSYESWDSFSTVLFSTVSSTGRSEQLES
jgi:hypothetical protein